MATYAALLLLLGFTRVICFVTHRLFRGDQSSLSLTRIDDGGGVIIDGMSNVSSTT